MASTRVPHADIRRGVLDVILDAVDDGAVLLGTISSLADSLGLTATELRSGLTELLEAELVTVNMEPSSQVSVRHNVRADDLADRPV